MRIGEASRASGIPVETIRYYERIGLSAAPERDVNGYRRYSDRHLQRLLFIKRCRNLDMAQDEIRELLHLTADPDADCQGVDELLERHLNHVRQRLDELLQLERVLKQLHQACSSGNTVSRCGILEKLANELPEAPLDRRHNHVPTSHGKS